MGTISNLKRRFTGGGRSHGTSTTSRSGGGGGLGRLVSQFRGKGRRR